MRFGNSKKNLVLFVAVVLVLLVLSLIQTALAFSGAGSGTETDPYIITNVAQLQEMQGGLNVWYELGNDVNAFDTVNWNGGAGFIPVGAVGVPFVGSLDGGGRKIVNLFINRPATNYVGLFGYVGTGGVVENVGLENENVTGNWYMGGLIGYIYYGTVSNCYSTGSVSGNGQVGGLVGFNAGGTVSNSFWDIETSGWSTSAGGTGKTTDEMKTLSTFTSAGWDFNTPVWTIDEGIDYPHLWWESTVPASWLSGWNCRKEQTITGSADAQTNYQMKMTVHKGSGTDSNTDVYCGGNCKDDFRDIRWTTGDGTTLMDYWIESVVGGDKAIFWIKIPSIPASPGTVGVYMYYGKCDDVTSDSNGDNTFEFFDTFSGGSLDGSKWEKSISLGGSISVSDGKLTISQISGGPLETRMWTDNSYPKYTVTEFKVSQPAGWDNGYRQSWFGRGESGSQGGSNRVAFWTYEDGQRYFNVYNSGNSSDSSCMTEINPINNYVYELVWSNSTNALLYVYNENRSSLLAQRTLGTNVPTIDLGVYFSTYSWGNVSQITCDWVFVRKYAFPEPTWGTWGPAEGGGFALAGDLNDDCRVDFYDFAKMASNWLIDCTTDPNNPQCVRK